MARQRPFDPFAGQPRSTRRPGTFNEQAEAQPDPNVESVGTHASAVGGGPIDWFVSLFRSIGRRRRSGEDRIGDDSRRDQPPGGPHVLGGSAATTPEPEMRAVAR